MSLMKAVSYRYKGTGCLRAAARRCGRGSGPTSRGAALAEERTPVGPEPGGAVHGRERKPAGDQLVERRPVRPPHQLARATLADRAQVFPDAGDARERLAAEVDRHSWSSPALMSTSGRVFLPSLTSAASSGNSRSASAAS